MLNFYKQLTHAYTCFLSLATTLMLLLLLWETELELFKSLLCLRNNYLLLFWEQKLPIIGYHSNKLRFWVVVAIHCLFFFDRWDSLFSQFTIIFGFIHFRLAIVKECLIIFSFVSRNEKHKGTKAVVIQLCVLFYQWQSFVGFKTYSHTWLQRGIMSASYAQRDS